MYRCDSKQWSRTRASLNTRDHLRRQSYNKPPEFLSRVIPRKDFILQQGARWSFDGSSLTLQSIWVCSCWYSYIMCCAVMLPSKYYLQFPSRLWPAFLCLWELLVWASITIIYFKETFEKFFPWNVSHMKFFSGPNENIYSNTLTLKVYEQLIKTQTSFD
jgi:hypothetical protein